MSGKLYTPEKYYRAYRIQIAAQYSGFKLQLLPFVAGSTNKDAEYLKKFPTGSAPSFETDDGSFQLFEVNAIAEYVGGACAQLNGGSDISKQAEVRQWINWADGEIAPAMATWVYPCLGVSQYNKSATERAREAITDAMKMMNEHLASRTFLVGERISQADITCFCNLVPLMEHVLDPAARSKNAHVDRWFHTMANQPQTKAVVAEVKLCEKEGKFDGKKYAELHPKDKKQGGGGGGGDGKKKKEEPKKKDEPKKKEAKPEPAPFLTAAEMEAMESKKEEKDPFKKLPAGNFDMDEFKRCISNNDALTVAIPFFWEKFEAENYSLWACEYLYANELTFDFMSLNLIGGMLQRLDKMRKYSFGVTSLFGEKNNWVIKGLWFWRGQELAFNLHPDLQIDYETYKWTKLDPAADSTKKLVEAYFSKAEEVDGRKVHTHKVFK